MAHTAPYLWSKNETSNGVCSQQCLTAVENIDNDSCFDANSLLATVLRYRQHRVQDRLYHKDYCFVGTAS